jgi:hypothetical protein
MLAFQTSADLLLASQPIQSSAWEIDRKGCAEPARRSGSYHCRRRPGRRRIAATCEPCGNDCSRAVGGLTAAHDAPGKGGAARRP